ncbi:TlpA family protein disulfide reductase [Flavobacterium sp. ANB]|uniref:TlpA family protein disulfide reductase n=1 Tax=unclassified Flavobacterium TaxID=196869 RepID=UPI0012B6E208|nr:MULTISPECIES: TlpA disulfide reductase family protein [unclassified Flavobacterium]MBF4518768.1 TlpA family protein disulfide reductase [Flavobacterium sp. ANB]MTD71519.1 redoxin domain-containing protein [Flavobacterium sp. LC2016-13]
MRIILPLFLVFFLCQYSNAQKNNCNEPIENPSLITKDFQSFWNYYNTYIQLSSDFVGLNSNSSVLKKEEFLRLLLSGKYLPLRLKCKRPIYYKLLKVNSWSSNDIPDQIKNMANMEYGNFLREGKPFKKFSYTDLNGNIYNTYNTKGKIIVLKFWFINCQKCVEEMPSLNMLVKKYENRKDILFISLAFDENKKLKEFLKKKMFKYAVIGNQEDYILKNLGLQIFPTHMIISKMGNVTKVVNSYSELEIALKKEISK